jgi:hypothetical protein
MALISLGGIPGAGKNLTGVYLAKRHYKSENNFIKRIIRKRKGLEKIYNNVYSNFPILLDKKNNVWSNEVSIHQLNGEYRFRENAFIEIDEMQISFDSMEYKDFPDCIAHFFQAHRHLEYNAIYTNSQSLSRIIKRVLVVTQEYWRIIESKKILWWVITDYELTWDLASGNETKVLSDDLVDREHIRIRFNAKRAYEAYDTKYLKGLKEKAKRYNNEMWTKLQMSYDEIMDCFFPTDYEKKELANERY